MAYKGPKPGGRIYSDHESTSLIGPLTKFELIDLSGANKEPAVLVPSLGNGCRVILVEELGNVVVDLIDRDNIPVIAYKINMDRAQIAIANVTKVYNAAGGTTATGVSLGN